MPPLGVILMLVIFGSKVVHVIVRQTTQYFIYRLVISKISNMQALIAYIYILNSGNIGHIMQEKQTVPYSITLT